MKKIFFLISFILLMATNTRLVSADAPAPLDQEHIAMEESCGGTEMPLGDGEEQQQEDKDVTGEEDDDMSMEHRLISQGKSNITSLHFLYQEIIFNDLKVEVLLPPPKV